MKSEGIKFERSIFQTGFAVFAHLCEFRPCRKQCKSQPLHKKGMIIFMRISSFLHFLKDSLKNIWHNRIMSVASVGVLCACLILMGCIMMLSINITSFIGEIEAQNEIVVFIEEDITEEEIIEVGNKIMALSNVRDVEFLDNEKAFEEYKLKLGQDSDILNNITTPLRHMYKIQLHDLSKIQETIYQLDQIDNVANIREHSDTANKLNNIKKAVFMLGIWVIGIMAVVSVFIISNTIKLTVFARSYEISIMKSIGATDWFVKWPFIIEGLILGVAGALVAFFIQWYIYSNIFEILLSNIQFMRPMPFVQIWKQIFFGFFSTGFIIGVFGSAISLRKYLKSSDGNQ